MSMHSRAVFQALFVTFLWSTSWILIKIGLEGIPPLTFGGLRYSLAFLFLLLFAARQGKVPKLRDQPRSTWIKLIILGLLLYAVTQGAVFLGLYYLQAITLNLVLSFSAVLVALAGIVLLRERPSSWQWLGIALSVIGALLFFYPASFSTDQATGLLIAFIGLSANAVSSILGRHVNHTLRLDPTMVTLVSMGVGGITLLVVGTLAQGFPTPTATNWIIVLWLALVNSAFAFTLWNRTLQSLSAMESSVINNTMMIQIPIFAWLFLGERPTSQQLLGMALAAAGIILVQLRIGKRTDSEEDRAKN